MTKKGSTKETGEEVSQEDWKRFEAAVQAEGEGAREPRRETSGEEAPATTSGPDDPTDPAA